MSLPDIPIYGENNNICTCLRKLYDMEQKKETYYSKEISGIVAFRNNIEDILNILTDNGLKVNLQDDKHFYDDIDEVVKNVGPNPKNLKTQARNEKTHESVDLSFNKNSLSISCYGSEQMYSLGFRLKEYFSMMIPWHYKVFNPWIYYVLTITPMFTLTYAFDNSTHEVTRPWILVLFAFSITLWLFSIFLRKNAYGIRLVKVHEHGFWKRNKDSLIVSLISAAIGAILGMLVTLLVQYINN